MDKIYSRKVIKVPKIKMFFSNNRKSSKMVKVIAVFAIAFAVVFGIYSSINPVYDSLARNQAKVISTEIVNIESSKILREINYEDLVKIEKDNNNNITMLKFDVIKMNMLASDIAYNIQAQLNNPESNIISIPLGSFFGIKYIAGIGPRIEVKLLPAGNVITDFRSSFESVGINQTIHRIYLKVTSKVSIISGYDIIQEDITNQVLMAETVIVGKIPESYYNLSTDELQPEDTTTLMR